MFNAFTCFIYIGVIVAHHCLYVRFMPLWYLQHFLLKFIMVASGACLHQIIHVCIDLATKCNTC